MVKLGKTYRQNPKTTKGMCFEVVAVEIKPATSSTLEYVKMRHKNGVEYWTATYNFDRKHSLVTQ